MSCTAGWPGEMDRLNRDLRNLGLAIVSGIVAVAGTAGYLLRKWTAR